MIIKTNTQNDPEVVQLQARISTINANLASQKKSLDERYASVGC